MDIIKFAGREIGTDKTTNFKCVGFGWEPKPHADKMHLIRLPREKADDLILPVHEGCLAIDYATFGSVVAIAAGARDESKF